MMRPSNIRAHLRFRPNGEVYVSSRVCRLLDARAGDCINIYETRQGNVLLYVSARQGSLRGKLYAPNGAGGRSLRCQWKALCSCMGYGDYRCGDLMTEDGITGVSVITRSRLNGT